MENNLTSIQVKVSLKEKLDSLKLIPRETYNDVIERMIDAKNKK